MSTATADRSADSMRIRDSLSRSLQRYASEAVSHLVALRAFITTNEPDLDRDEVAVRCRDTVAMAHVHLDPIQATPMDRVRQAARQLGGRIVEHHKDLDRDVVVHELRQIDLAVDVWLPKRSADSTDCADARTGPEVPSRSRRAILAGEPSAQSAQSADDLPVILTGPGGDFTTAYTPGVESNIQHVDVMG